VLVNDHHVGKALLDPIRDFGQYSVDLAAITTHHNAGDDAFRMTVLAVDFGCREVVLAVKAR